MLKQFKCTCVLLEYHNSKYKVWQKNKILFCYRPIILIQCDHMLLHENNLYMYILNFHIELHAMKWTYYDSCNGNII